MNVSRRGLFCLEGFWYGDHRDRTSVIPLLEAVHRFSKMPFIHHRCGTVDEFKFSVERWKKKAFHRKYPLLYLAFHGEKGTIRIGKESISLEEMADLLQESCEGRVIYFGGCETLHIHLRKLKTFLKKTRMLAILGYRREVEWMISASFDILLLNMLTDPSIPFDKKGMRQVSLELRENFMWHTRVLDFRMEINENRLRTIKKA